MDLCQPVHQLLRAVHAGVAVLAEEHRQVVLRLLVDGDAEGRQAGVARGLHRVAGVFQAVAALVVVDVVGLAVGQQQQQALALGTRRQAQRGMADRRADAGVVARPDRADARAHRLVPGLVEALQVLDAHVVAAHRAEAEHLEGVAAARQRLAEDMQRVADHVDHAGVVADMGVGRQRQVGQQQRRQAALVALAAQEDGRRLADRVACVVDAVAHPGVEVDLVAVGPRARQHWRGAQRLQPPAHPPRGGPQRRRGPEGRGLARDQALHRAVVGHQPAGLPVPFGQALPRAERPVVGGRAGQIEVEAHPRGAAPAVGRDRQLGHLVGGAAGRVVGLVVVGTVDAYELAPGQDGLGAEEHQQRRRVALVGHRLRVAARLRALRMPLLRRGLVVRVGRIGAGERGLGGRGLRLDPQPDRRDLVGAHRRVVPGGAERRGGGRVVEHRAQRGRHRTLGPGGAAVQALARRPRGQLRRQQALQPRLQAGKPHQRPPARAQVVLDPVAGGRRLLQRGGQRGQPQVERAVERALGQHRQPRRQRQHLGLQARAPHLRAGAGQALQPVARAALGAHAGLGQPHRRRAAAGAEHQLDGTAHLAQIDRGGLVATGLAAGGAGDEAVPLAPDPFLHVRSPCQCGAGAASRAPRRRRCATPAAAPAAARPARSRRRPGSVRTARTRTSSA